MLNVIADLLTRMSAVLAVDVRIRVPDPRPDELIVISREGGSRENNLIDAAGVGIYCWAASEARAWALADEVADVMARLPFAGGYADVSMEAMYSDPDPATLSPRYYLSYTIKTYNPL